MTATSPATASSIAPASPAGNAAEISTTKAGLLAEAIGKGKFHERATLIARHLEDNLTMERAAVSRLAEQLSAAKEVKARLETQVQTMRNQTFPSLFLQARSGTAGAVGGYLLGVKGCAAYGWVLLALAFVAFVAAGWFQLAHPKLSTTSGGGS